MYGWRAVIGVMLPSSCTVYEQEFIKMTSMLDGVIACSTRLLIHATDAAGLGEMNKGIKKAAGELATLDPDLTVYMCTAGSFMEGTDREQAIRDMITEITGSPTISTSQAVVEAHRALGLSRVAMWTPYDQDLTEREVEFLASKGIKVTDYAYGDIIDNLDRGKQPPEVTGHNVKRLDTSEADGLFISCANIRAIEVIDDLEKDKGLPVISSSQATTWYALRNAGFPDLIEGYGSLLREF